MVTWVYTAIMLTAIVSCSFLLRGFQKKLPISTSNKIWLAIAAFIGAMIGAKLPFVLLGEDSLFSGFTWLSNGKTIMFGIAGGYFSVVLAKRLLRIRIPTGDSFAFPVAVAVSLGRLACFSAGCCFGVETDLPWGVHFSAVDQDISVRRHPIQIYESLFHAFCAVTILLAYSWLHSKSRAERGVWDILFYGNLLKVYIISYFLFRFTCEFIRPEPTWFASVSVYQVAALVLSPIFVGMWILDVLTKLNNLKMSRQRQHTRAVK